MDAQGILKTYFGYAEFRQGQKEIIDNILAGRDVLAVMPTGAGKSICYQVPAMLLDGITLVISPLISLMQDQVKSLAEAGIRAAYINSSLTEGQITKALALARQGAFKIMYVAPERLESYNFLEFARDVNISMVTVDEAHCISQWGQDFRPSYLKITEFVRELRKRPIVSAFTATATAIVRTDIEKLLELDNPYELTTGFDRENLSYWVVPKGGKAKTSYILNYIAAHSSDSGIIYCSTRKQVESLYDELCEKDVPVTLYHAGLDGDLRKRNQDDFVYDRKPIMIATNAFGMGIDKSNVRYVIHYSMPSCMENYYQEAGRAGRDGLDSECILLYSGQDIILQKFFMRQKEYYGVNTPEAINLRLRDKARLRTMIDYCQGEKCLRSYILKYFGERSENECANCSNCLNVEPDLAVFNPKTIKYNTAEDFVSYEPEEIVTTEIPTEKPLLPTEKKISNKKKPAKVQESEIDKKLFERLRSLRREISSSKNVPPYIIFSDDSLKDMVAKKPLTNDEFLDVRGVGQKKLSQYGAVFMKEIADYLGDSNSQSENVSLVMADEQSISEPKPQKTGKGSKWTIEEEHQLKQEYESHKSIEEIAELHQRTQGAVISRMRQLGILTFDNGDNTLENYYRNLGKMRITYDLLKKGIVTKSALVESGLYTPEEIERIEKQSK